MWPSWVKTATRWCCAAEHLRSARGGARLVSSWERRFSSRARSARREPPMTALIATGVLAQRPAPSRRPVRSVPRCRAHCRSTSRLRGRSSASTPRCSSVAHLGVIHGSEPGLSDRHGRPVLICSDCRNHWGGGGGGGGGLPGTGGRGGGGSFAVVSVSASVSTEGGARTGCGAGASQALGAPTCPEQLRGLRPVPLLRRLLARLSVPSRLLEHQREPAGSPIFAGEAFGSAISGVCRRSALFVRVELERRN